MTIWLLTVSAVALLLTGSVPTSEPSESDRVPSSADSAGGIPDDWRWESFGGVELAVPDAWGHGVADQPWCPAGKQPAPPHVGRPGLIPLINCPNGTDGNDPGTSLSTGGTFVWFKPSDKWQTAPQLSGDRLTAVVAGIEVGIQAPADLRDQIFATLRTIPEGTNGCPADHPIKDDFRWRPSPGRSVADLTGVTAVSACKYSYGILWSTLRFTGGDAAAAVNRVAQSPVGGGPNTPWQCVPEAAYGDEVIVLRITSAEGLTEIVLRYHGCDWHGFDDGVAVRTLTREATLPFVAGPNQLTGGWHSNLTNILWPGRG